MSDVFREYNEIEWRSYDTLSALLAFEHYSQETERMVASEASIAELLNGPKWTPTSPEEVSEYSGDRRVARHLHDEIITPTFRYASVVTLFAIFERELKRAADNLAKEGRAKISYKDLKGGLLDQVGKYTEAFCGFGVSELPGYGMICDLQKIRDCVVHCYGDLSLSRDRKYLLTLHSPIKGLDIHDGLPIEIAPTFIEISLAAVRDFFRALFTKLGWKINDRWRIEPGNSGLPDKS